MDARADVALMIKREIADRKLSVRGLAALVGLPPRSVQNILEGKEPRVNRAAEICEALGLEFYIGPPRDDDMPSADRSPETARAKTTGAPASRAEAALDPTEFASDVKEAVRDQMATILRSEAASIREEVCEGITEHLMAVQDEAISRQRSPHSLEDERALVPAPGFGESQETRHVEIVQFAAAAGGGAEAFEERVVGTLAFCRQWMDRYGLRPLDCVVIDVHGESMEPTLWGGASILIDRTRTEWRPGNILVIRLPDGVVVKRAGEDEAGNRQLVSDHPAWEPVPYPDDAEIIGQVAWTARTLIGRR